jgi:hypothetical protein
MKAQNRLARRRPARSGQALLEFTLLGIPMLCITTSIMCMALDAWQLWSLSYATDSTARYISMRGATCAENGNSCTITTGQVATYFESQAMALSSGSVNVTLADGSGTTNCNPVSTCNSGSAQFPASSANNVGSDITVKATYQLTNPIFMIWGSINTIWGGVNGNNYSVGAKSRVRIQF